MLEAEEIVSGQDFEPIARKVVRKTLGRDTPQRIVDEEAVSLAYTLAEAAHARIYELAAEFVDD